MSSDDGWASALRAAIERLGPVGLIVGGAIGGALWLESQQPGTMATWAAGFASWVTPTDLAVIALAAAAWRSRERDREQNRKERRETAAALREMAQATSDSSGVMAEEMAKIRARLDAGQHP